MSPPTRYEILAEQARLDRDREQAALVDKVAALIEGEGPDVIIAALAARFNVCGRCWSSSCSGWCDYVTGE